MTAGSVPLVPYVFSSIESDRFVWSTVLSLVAQLLLTRRHIDNWPVWIFGVNVPYIALYLYKGLALTAALQLVFIAISAMGWRRWLREAHDGRTEAVAPTPALERAA